MGDVVVVPWAVSCGSCYECGLGLTAKCATMRANSPGGTLAAFGFGPATGAWGGMVADSLRVPHADHLLVRVPEGVDPLRVAAAGDNLADAWRAVVPPLRMRPDGTVLVIGGGAQSIGLYAAGLAVRHGASRVDYVDDSDERLAVAEKLGARVRKAGGTTAHVGAVGGERAGTTSRSRRRPGSRAFATRSGRSARAASAPEPATTWLRGPRCR